MNKYIIWGCCLMFAVINVVLSLLSDDPIKKQGFLNNSASYTAASFVILALP